jgi:hypothetical protein
MGCSKELVPRLEGLFGGVWQAALDHAGVLSRRRARDIGAGEEPSGALRAMVELLERLPPAEWPERWRGLGKSSETCPTLTMRSERLLDGKIRPEDAVLVWDLGAKPSGGVPFHADVAVGFLPRGCFAGLPRSDAARTRWRLWYGQWDDCHGGGAADGWMASEGETPEGLLAAWVASGTIGGEDLERALSVLSTHVVGFAPAKVAEAAERRREAEPEPVGA